MNCKNCNKTTDKWGNKYKKYCDIKCQREFELISKKKIFESKNCIICNKDFIPKTSVNICCSHECKVKNDINKQSNKPKSKVCKNCDKEYIPYTSLDKFCSANCRIDNQKKGRKFKWSKESIEKRSGKNNPAYKHGLKIIGTKQNNDGLREFQRNRKEYINDIKEKYDYVFCEKCNKSNVKLEAHHIIYRSEKPYHKYLHKKINITLVCVKCHNWYHNKKSNRNEIVIERKLNEYFGNDVLDK